MIAQKSSRLGKRASRNRVSSEEVWKSRRSRIKRATVPGIEDQNHVAVHSSRVLLINRLIQSNDENSFISQQHDRIASRIYPTYPNFHNKNRNSSALSIYPLQSLRWNPYVETSSFEDIEMDNFDQSSHKCSCDICTMDRNFSEESASGWSGFRDNIVQFSERCTMTPRLTDAACGGRESLPRTCDSQTSIPHPITNLHTDSFYSRRFIPPILKKTKAISKPREFNSGGFDFGSYYTDCDFEDHCKYKEAEKDANLKRLDRMNAIKSYSLKWCDDFDSVDKSYIIDRKNIYNEGISDSVAYQYPMAALAIPSLRPRRSTFHIGNTRSTNGDENPTSRIPHSHRSASRYHHCCKESVGGVNYKEDDGWQPVGGSPGLLLRPHLSSTRQTARSMTPPSKQPKKVLTSEKDIDSFIEQAAVLKANSNIPF